MNASDGATSRSDCVIRVRVFAGLRDVVGTDVLEVPAQCEQPGCTTIAALRQAIRDRWPQAAGLSSSLLFAIGTEYADDQTIVTPDDEVACFPPVSGG